MKYINTHTQTHTHTHTHTLHKHKHTHTTQTQTHTTQTQTHTHTTHSNTINYVQIVVCAPFQLINLGVILYKLTQLTMQSDLIQFCNLSIHAYVNVHMNAVAKQWANQKVSNNYMVENKNEHFVITVTNQ